MKHSSPLLRTLVALLLAGAASLPALAQTTSDAPDGAALFESRCALCHRGSGPGVFMLERRVGKELAILEERDNLTEAFLQAVVRNGIGSMPRFSRGELTDAELAALARYLEAR
jgi:mono/diheme cytochrome c family protein